MEKRVVVSKNGKLLMANKFTAREFAGVSKAIPFVRNLIRVSNKLTLDNFKFIFVK